MEQFYKQQSWSGGLSDSPLFGVEGSFAEAVGVDIHSQPKVLKVSQALVKESGNVVVDFIKFSINASTGDSYYFGDAGNIYKRTSAGAWTVAYTDANGAILGACEFNGYIYWATSTKLGRQSSANAASEVPWSSQNNVWQNLTAATYHPMIRQGLYLFIGNNRNIATVDDVGTFTAAGTPDVTYETLPPQYSISAMCPYGIDFLVGTTVTSTYSSARVFRWDFTNAAWLTDDDIPEIGVNCFIPNDNYVFIQAGNQGRLYFYDGTSLEKIKTIQGDYANKTMVVYPGSYCAFRGIALFGVSNLSNNPCLEGVYSIGQYDRNYPMALSLPYVISPNKTTSISVGALLSQGSTLLVAWKDGTTYGVDAISWSLKNTSAYIKTLVLGGEREKSKTFLEHLIGYKQKPSGTNITLTYDKNFAGSFAGSITLRDESDYNKLFSQNKFDAGVAQYKIAFTVSGNDAPEIDLFFTKWDSADVL